MSQISVGNEISTAVYLRERLDPQPGDYHYLHLADMHRILSEKSIGVTGKILDYGCGGSPYRQLFLSSHYVRADIAGTPAIDLEINVDGSVHYPDESFDTVLSTQVLEHVPDPLKYLAEAYRLLKPGGSLLLTTHGSFMDHGCPYDYRRWTADGLRLDANSVGFFVQNVEKLTCGTRALVSMIDWYSKDLSVTNNGAAKFFGKAIAFSWRRLRSTVHRAVDRLYPNHVREISRGDEDASGSKIYIAICLVASRPK